MKHLFTIVILLASSLVAYADIASNQYLRWAFDDASEASGCIMPHVQWQHHQRVAGQRFDSGYVTVGEGATGIICNADFCSIDANIVGRGPNAKALEVEKPIGNLKARLKISGCGKGVDLQQLGHNNRIEIDGMKPVVKLPAPGWGARNNRIEINGVAVEDK